MHMVVATVFSVGPYALISVRPLYQYRIADNAVVSPPNTMTLSAGRALRGITGKMAGGIVAKVTACFSSKSVNKTGSFLSSGSATTNVAPADNTGKISKTEASKLMLANNKPRLSADKLNFWISAAIR